MLRAKVVEALEPEHVERVMSALAAHSIETLDDLKAHVSELSLPLFAKEKLAAISETLADNSPALLLPGGGLTP